MELELKKEQFACYQALPQLSENREETTETIVPDYLPDIARIVDASGCLFLRSREIADGKAQVSGTVRMTLLYVAEDAQGMKSARRDDRGARAERQRGQLPRRPALLVRGAHAQSA